MTMPTLTQRKPTRNRLSKAAESVPPSRTQAATDALLQIARECGAANRLPSFVELREQIGVSVVTLNKALADLEARHILHRRHGVGIFVLPEITTRTIALMCNPLFFTAAEVSPFWHILVEQVRASVAQEGHQLVFQFLSELSHSDFDTVRLQSEVRDAVKAGHIHGVLGIGLGDKTTKWLESKAVPVVCFAGEGRYRVGFDNSVQVTSGIPELLRQGCRRIGFWENFAYQFGDTDTGQDAVLVTRFKHEMHKNGADVLPNMIREARRLPRLPDGKRAETFWEQGYHTANTVFSFPASHHPDGIICTSELMVQGAIIALERRGIRVGKNVQIVAHANIGSRILFPWENDIVRVANDPAELARTMLSHLEARMHGGTPPSRETLLAPKIFERQPVSCL